MSEGAVDVTVATLNSSRTIGKCLESITSYLPYRRIVVVDGGSSDGTVEICRRFGAEVIREPGFLGRVRYVQALNCETDWIVFVDSDAYLYPGWWSEVSKYMGDEVGDINCLIEAPVSKLKIYHTFFRFLAVKFGLIGFAGSLIRRGPILECKDELERVHAGEDAVICDHIRSKGMKIITVGRPLCFHDQDPYIGHRFAYYRWGQSIRVRYGPRGLTRALRSFRDQVALWYRFTTETKRFSIKLLIFLLFLSSWLTIGFLRGIRKR